jgi:hypothetical protein
LGRIRMSEVDPGAGSFKETLKAAIAETLHEQRGLLHDVFAEVLEDFAMAEAIREGKETNTVPRDALFRPSYGRRRPPQIKLGKKIGGQYRSHEG